MEEKSPSLKEQIFGKKEELAIAKSEFKKFRKAYGIRDIEKVKEPKTIEEYKAHEAKVGAIQADLDELQAQAETKKSAPRGSYAYGEIIDPQTGESRPATKSELKRWRAKSRKEAKSKGIKPQEIAWDPNFLVKPEKVEKPKKEKKVKAEESDPSLAPDEATPVTPVTPVTPKTKGVIPGGSEKKKKKADLD